MLSMHEAASETEFTRTQRKRQTRLNNLDRQTTHGRKLTTRNNTQCVLRERNAQPPGIAPPLK